MSRNSFAPLGREGLRGNNTMSSLWSLVATIACPFGAISETSYTVRIFASNAVASFQLTSCG